MKKQHFISNTLAAMCFAFIVISCEQDKIDPAIVLHKALIPEGYIQEINPSTDAMTRLDEFRLKNPDDHFYYLKRTLPDQENTNWMFAQKELLIAYAEPAGDTDEKIKGVIVKKIKGDWRNEEFSYYDSHPMPVGGMKALYEALGQNIHYPEEAKKERIQGKVFVEFTVDKSGILRDVKAIKGIGYGCDEEAVRAVAEAVQWEPARIADMSVSTRMILPVSFKLE
jgi:TonB family protein